MESLEGSALLGACPIKTADLKTAFGLRMVTPLDDLTVAV